MQDLMEAVKVLVILCLVKHQLRLNQKVISQIDSFELHLTENEINL